MNKKIYLSVAVLFSVAKLFPIELIPTSQLLLAYLENDKSLKELAIDVEKQKLSNQSSELDKEFNIKLSTGDMKMTFGEDGNFSVKPKVTMDFPEYSNLKTELSTGVSVKDKTSLSDAKLGVSVDIISTFGAQRDIDKLKSERSLLEAERKIQKEAISVEKSFYTELKKLISTASSIVNKKQDLYEAMISFEKVKAQGYSKQSVTYRQAEMKVYSDNHDIENSIRSLRHDYIVFYKKCGYDIEFSTDMDFMELIPNDIEEVELLSIRDFSPSNYAETEEAVWNHKIKSMERQLNNNFSLAATGGYTFKNTELDNDDVSEKNATKKEPVNTIDVGLKSSIGGLDLSLGSSIPVTGEKKSPSITLSVDVTPNTYKKKKITEQQNVFDEEKELMNIDSARSNFGTFVVDALKQKEDLLWEKQSNDESYELYANQEKELANWYKQGVISQSEYLSAKNNMQSSFVKKIENLIDRIIYNNDIKSKFVQ